MHWNREQFEEVGKTLKICHWVFRPDSVTYMVAKAVTAAEHQICIWITDPEHGRIEPNKITLRLERMPGIKLVYGHQSDWPSVVDRLIVQVFPRPLQYTLGLATLAKRARRITLITAGDRSRLRSRAIRLQWKEVQKLGLWWRRIDRVVYKDGPYPFDLYAAFKPRRVLGFDIHSMFMHDAEAFKYIQAQDWEIDSIRPNLINFMGSQDPAPRTRILDSVRQLFAVSEARCLQAHTRKRMFWHEYSDANPDVLGLKDFVNVLSASDFTLCPPGYSVITHRPIEALLRGSVPLLHEDELDIYDVGLVDGVNCIAVKPGRWPAAVKRCFEMGSEDVIDMRRKIREIVKDRLLYPSSSRRMRVRLGFCD